MSAKKIRKPSTSDDRATDYARKVVAGDIVAGPYVRAACARHLDDLDRGHERGLMWDLDDADYHLGFFRHVLKLNGGQWEGKPFDPLPWQAFIIQSLFGWKGSDGYRRFRTAYIETGKGSGKSPLLAGIGIDGMIADGESRAEIYAAATKRDQAAILFRDAVAMVRLSPDLAERIHISGSNGNEFNMAHQESASFFRPISSDKSQSGPRPHIGLLDEVHEHKNRAAVDLMRAGVKWRRQALICMITNSGTDPNSVCGEYHAYACKVAQRQLEDDSFFSYVCALDEDDKPFENEACWPKANPSLEHGVPGYRYIREQVQEAQGMPGKESVVLRLNFCKWTAAESPWIGGEAWKSAYDQYYAKDLVGRHCYGGLDLSSTRDLTAFVLLFDPTKDDPYWRLLPYFWLPDNGLAEKSLKDDVPYMAWRKAGLIETTPGNAISKLFVAQRVVQICQKFSVEAIGYDRWRIEDLKQLLADDGQKLPLEDVGQGFQSMAEPVNNLERDLLNGKLKHNGNPCMTWCAASAVVDQDPAGNRKVTKSKATGRVDGIVAALNAYYVSAKRDRPGPSVYERRGLLMC